MCAEMIGCWKSLLYFYCGRLTWSPLKGACVARLPILGHA
jgi:hypothetical protein